MLRCPPERYPALPTSHPAARQRRAVHSSSPDSKIRPRARKVGPHPQRPHAHHVTPASSSPTHSPTEDRVASWSTQRRSSAGFCLTAHTAAPGRGVYVRDRPTELSLPAGRRCERHRLHPHRAEPELSSHSGVLPCRSCGTQLRHQTAERPLRHQTAERPAPRPAAGKAETDGAQLIAGEGSALAVDRSSGRRSALRRLDL